MCTVRMSELVILFSAACLQPFQECGVGLVSPWMVHPQRARGIEAKAVQVAAGRIRRS